MIVRSPFLHAVTVLACCAIATTSASGGQGAGKPLFINELMASNGTTVPDPQGQYDDWIELYNGGGQAINVGGMYLTDDPETPTMWRFPTDRAVLTTIPPGGYLLVWADADTGDTGLHTSFRLNSDGDTIALVDVDGRTVIDMVEFDKQKPNI